MRYNFGITNNLHLGEKLDPKHNHTPLPLIHLQPSKTNQNGVKEDEKNLPKSLSHSLTSTQLHSLQPRHHNCLVESTMKKNENYHPKKTVAIPKVGKLIYH